MKPKGESYMTVPEMLEVFDKRVTSYKTDIEIDRKLLTKAPHIPRLFFVRDWGTHCISLLSEKDLPPAGERVPYLFGTADRKHLVRQAGVMMEYFTGMNKEHHYDVYYVVQGHALEITLKEAATIVEEYNIRMAKQLNMD